MRISLFLQMQRCLVVIGILTGMISCRSLYYNTLERIGWEKRHILANRVEASRREQVEAQEQFQTAFERFKEVTKFEGGDLEEMYRKLRDEFERSEEKAESVRQRIQSVDQVAGDLFIEWETELEEISNADLRRRSAERLRRTQAQYRQFINAMRRAASKMDPVLTAFRDQVLFLKHNLNAAAIASLGRIVTSIETDVEDLIQELAQAIHEAESFLASIEG